MSANPAFVAQMDQVGAHLEVMGNALGLFYRSLCHAGFDPDAALCLCRDWMEFYLVETE